MSEYKIHKVVVNERGEVCPIQYDNLRFYGDEQAKIKVVQMVELSQLIEKPVSLPSGKLQAEE